MIRWRLDEATKQQDVSSFVATVCLSQWSKAFTDPLGERSIDDVYRLSAIRRYKPPTAVRKPLAGLARGLSGVGLFGSAPLPR